AVARSAPLPGRSRVAINVEAWRRMRVRAEIHSQPVIASTRVAPFLVGRVVGADRDEPRSIGSRVIAPSSDSFALEVETDTVIPVPDTLETADALLIPPAAIA